MLRSVAGSVVQAQRLYDGLGRLLPARVDPDTGYRWYAATQLDQARLVASLGRADVPLAPIAIEALFAWAPEQQRQPSGGVCSVLIPNPASGGAGP
jgi:hypothetical protein